MLQRWLYANRCWFCLTKVRVTTAPFIRKYHIPLFWPHLYTWLVLKCGTHFKSAQEMISNCHISHQRCNLHVGRIQICSEPRNFFKGSTGIAFVPYYHQYKRKSLQSFRIEQGFQTKHNGCFLYIGKVNVFLLHFEPLFTIEFQKQDLITILLLHGWCIGSASRHFYPFSWL